MSSAPADSEITPSMRASILSLWQALADNPRRSVDMMYDYMNFTGDGSPVKGSLGEPTEPITREMIRNVVAGLPTGPHVLQHAAT